MFFYHFSYVKNVKTPARNKLLDSNLSNQLTVVLESAPIAKYDPTDAINIWSTSAARRPRQEMQTTSINISANTHEQIIEISDDHQETVQSANTLTESIEQTASVGQMSHVANDVQIADELNHESKFNKTVSSVELLECENTQVTLMEYVDSSQVAYDGVQNRDTSVLVGADLPYDANNNDVQKENRAVGTNDPMPMFMAKATQTDGDVFAFDESDEEYISDCDYYDNEYDLAMFEKKVKLPERRQFAQIAYSDFLSVIKPDSRIID